MITARLGMFTPVVGSKYLHNNDSGVLDLTYWTLPAK